MEYQGITRLYMMTSAPATTPRARSMFSQRKRTFSALLLEPPVAEGLVDDVRLAEDPVLDPEDGEPELCIARLISQAITQSRRSEETGKKIAKNAIFTEPEAETEALESEMP